MARSRSRRRNLHAARRRSHVQERWRSAVSVAGGEADRPQADGYNIMHRGYTNFASRLICVPARATETGQVFFVSSACSLNFASSIPGTSASVFKSIVVIFGPPPTISSFTVAVVLTRFAGCPAFSRFAERAIV